MIQSFLSFFFPLKKNIHAKTKKNIFLRSTVLSCLPRLRGLRDYQTVPSQNTPFYQTVPLRQQRQPQLHQDHNVNYRLIVLPFKTLFLMSRYFYNKFHCVSFKIQNSKFKIRPQSHPKIPRILPLIIYISYTQIHLQINEIH